MKPGIVKIDDILESLSTDFKRQLSILYDPKQHGEYQTLIVMRSLFHEYFPSLQTFIENENNVQNLMRLFKKCQSFQSFYNKFTNGKNLHHKILALIITRNINKIHNENLSNKEMKAAYILGMRNGDLEAYERLLDYETMPKSKLLTELIYAFENGIFNVAIRLWDLLGHEVALYSLESIIEHENFELLENIISHMDPEVQYKIETKIVQYCALKGQLNPIRFIVNKGNQLT